MKKRNLASVFILGLAVILILGCASGNQEAAADEGAHPSDDSPELVIYSGRSEALMGPLINMFEESSGYKVKVSYQTTAGLASQILTEGAASPADLFLAQDVGYLSLLGDRGMLTTINTDSLPALSEPFISNDKWWVGSSARARVLVIHPTRLDENERPASLKDLTDSRYQGRFGWAPGNASLHAHISVLREIWGEDETKQWIKGVMQNDPTAYPKNSPQVKAVANGEIDFGWVNHYYLHKLKDEVGDESQNYSFPEEGDAGNILMPSGVGILKASDQVERAQQFIRFLLSDEAQRYFTQEVYEYPAVQGVETHPDVTPLDQIGLASFDPKALTDLEGTLELLRELELQ